MKLPESIISAWESRKGPVVLATTDSDGNPNIIYVTCVNLFGDDRIVIADNYFCKTRENLKAPGKGSLLFITDEGKSYQLKGKLEYHKQGEIFDAMKSWNPSKHPGHAAAALVIEEAYSGAEKLLD
jgi:uncharacterized protein